MYVTRRDAERDIMCRVIDMLLQDAEFEEQRFFDIVLRALLYMAAPSP